MYQQQYIKNNPNAGKYAKGKSGKSKKYTVRKGDSLSKIASRNGVSVKQLCRLNGIKTTTKIRPGQKLKLK